jgi:methionyl aminopeptidase
MSWERQITIKTPEEIKIMRTAGRINAEALSAVHALIKPGVATLELNEAAEAVHRQYGVYSPFKNYPGPIPFPASICVSINDELVHGIPGDYRLKEGDIVSVDCGTVYEGFVGDSAFTAAVGSIDPQAQKLLTVTEQALYVGIDRMRAGNHIGDVSSAIESCVESSGFYITREYTGHGVGRKMHEGPQVPNYGIPGRGMKLRPGITVALEPMVLVSTASTRVQKDRWAVASLDGSLTAHFEHSIAVTQDGPYILTVLEDGSSPGQIAGQLNKGVL